jgi:hypothetical protein
MKRKLRKASKLYQWIAITDKYQYHRKKILMLSRAGLSKNVQVKFK